MIRYVFSLFCAISFVGCSNEMPQIDGVWHGDTERTMRDIRSTGNFSVEELAGYRKLFDETNLVLTYKAGLVGVHLYSGPTYWYTYRVVAVGQDHLVFRGDAMAMGDTKLIFHDNCYKVQQAGREWFEHFCKVEKAARVSL